MNRLPIPARENWLSQLTEEGVLWAITENGPYWTEALEQPMYYEFTRKEQEQLEKAANDIHAKCIETLEWFFTTASPKQQEYVFKLFNIPESMHSHIFDSWDRDEWGFYGRFDFIMTNKGPKLLEYNADTPTILIESAITQWNWFQDNLDTFNAHYQFNEIHESMVNHWRDMGKDNNLKGYVNFVGGNEVDDFATVSYIAETAMEAGLPVNVFEISEISLKDGMFFNPKEQHLNNCFKLYPWEWMMEDEFSKSIPRSCTRWIEPSWKMLLSNKALLVLLFERYPNCEYLVPAYTEPKFMFEKEQITEEHGSLWVSKPILSREGSNVSFFEVNGSELNYEIETSGPYAEELHIVQQRIEWQPIDGFYPMLGVWMVGSDSVGLGIREDDSPVTQNNSRFIPHVVKN